VLPGISPRTVSVPALEPASGRAVVLA